MAVKQYIGARYVPIFYTDSNGGNAWESGVQYEPLTIVTYLNQSYTSKKTVPASVGNPASNSEYWVITGGYNSQVAQLTEDVQELGEVVEDWRVTKIISIGASINLDTSGVLSGGFPALAFAALNMSADDYYNSAVGGSGFTTGTKTFEDQLDDAILALDDTFKNARGRIIVTGGMNNDINNGASYLAAVDDFVSKAHTNFPKFTIEFLPLSWSIQHATRVNLRTLYETYIKQMPDHGVTLWTEFYAYMHNYKEWFRDNIHFSQNGIDVMARNFMKVITRSSNDFNPNEGLKRPSNVANLDAAWNSDSGKFTNVREYYDGKNIYVYSGDNFLKPAADKAMSTSIGSPDIIGDNPYTYIGCTPYTDGQKYGEIPVSLRNAANTEETNAALYVDKNGKLVIYVRMPITLTTAGTANTKYWQVCIPKELC